MLIRRESPPGILAISAVHAAAFADRPERQTDREPTEVRLVRELRAGPDWLAELSLVAQAGGVVDRVSDGIVEVEVEVEVEVGVEDDLGLKVESVGEGMGEGEGMVVGHVCCSRGRLDDGTPALGLGPLGVLPSFQLRGVGTALMQAVLGAAVALDEPLVCLLGDTRYYRRFGFLPASQLGILAPDASWGDHFQALPLLTPGRVGSGRFSYAEAFDRVQRGREGSRGA